MKINCARFVLTIDEKDIIPFNNIKQKTIH